MNIRALRIVVGFELRRMLGPQGVLVVLALLVCFLPVSFALKSAVTEIANLRADTLGAPVLGPIYELIGWLLELAVEQVAELFKDRSEHLVAFFASGIASVPVLAYVTGFDQTASDIRSRYLRFLLLRVDRATLMLGRALTSVLVLSVGYLIAVVFFAVLLSGVEGGLGGLGDIEYLLRMWLSLVFLTLPFVALLAWTNAVTGHPYSALALAVGLQFGLWIVTLVGASMEVSFLEYASHLYPTAHKYKLLSEDFGALQIAALHQGGLTVIFTLLAWQTFRRRDLSARHSSRCKVW